MAGKYGSGIHLSVRRRSFRVAVAACGRWSDRLTEDPAQVTCDDCKGDWEFTARQIEARAARECTRCGALDASA